MTLFRFLSLFYVVISVSSLPQLLTAQISPKKDAAHVNGKLKYPVYVFAGTGDNLWTYDKEPVDSREAIDAMFDWMAETYQMRRMYWRGGQENLWHDHFRFGKETVMNYDYGLSWAKPIYSEHHISKAAIGAAKRVGAEIFLYTGLFEHGLQPDVGIIGPHLFEDTLRINHPEWAPLDRWGTRRAPGPISFAYPEARKIIVERYAKQVIDEGYDGINFYTYVENTGLRYLDEFGYNQPIVDAFRKRYPNVDLRAGNLTEEQRQYWYKCRGSFVTQFLKELKERIAPHGKKISMILDSEQPDFAQPWWGKPVPGTGMIHMDWKRWISEGLVDEFWVQLGPPNAQRVLLDSLLIACKGTSISLAVRTPDPYAPHWLPYVDAGVTPVAVITWLNNGIEQYAFQTPGIDNLSHNDWKVRLQTLDDIVRKKLVGSVKDIVPVLSDGNVLVRRKAMNALAVVMDTTGIPFIEQGLSDPQSSVRTAAAVALKKLHRQKSVDYLIASLTNQADFPLKTAASEAFAAMGRPVLPQLYQALTHTNYGVKEVVIRSLGHIGRGTFDSEVFDVLLRIAQDHQVGYRLRWWSLKSLRPMLINASNEQRDEFWQVIARILSDEEPSSLQLEAALAVEKSVDMISKKMKYRLVKTIAELFQDFGDGTQRSDAAYGWRPLGNALIALGTPGIKHLEKYRKQNADKWLAWLAYEVVYVEQRKIPTTIDGGFNLIAEEEAVSNHKKYAPVFPGWRKW